MPDPSRLLIAPDSRTAEEALFASLEEAIPPAASGTASIFRVRVVVPSNSLRRHLLARLVRRRSAWLGLEVLTLRSLALDLISRAGQSPPRGAALFELALARAARHRRTLAAAFGEFADGWAPLAAAARDLVDAGLRPEHIEPLAERLAAETGSLQPAALLRARALLESLGEALEDLEREGLAPDAVLYQRAAAALAEGRTRSSAESQVLYGFADATGAASDLIEALARYGRLTALVVAPGLRAPGVGWEFGGRLRERLAGALGGERRVPPAADPARWFERVASSPELEAREAVAAISRAIDEGVAPEAIGLVVRHPGPHRAALRRELDRWGVPFSGSAAVGPTDPAAYRAAALLRALESGRDTPVDVAIEIRGGDAAERGALRLAFRALGVARVGEALDLRAALLEPYRADGLPLPARGGFAAAAPEEDADEAAERPLGPLVRRRLPVDRLEAALLAIRQLVRGVERWPAATSWLGHRRALVAWLAGAGLTESAAGRRLLESAARLGEELPESIRLERRELTELLRRTESERSAVAAGGAGGGVQLLTLVEARGRTFDRLFVLGLVRGQFPRLVGIEPVLPDALRLRLRDLLPDLPVKSEGHDEERYLFAQLTGAAPFVVFSRSTADAAGRPLPPSPLLEALRRSGDLRPLPGGASQPEPLLDRAIASGLAGDARGLEQLLPEALEEGRRRFGATSARDARRAGRARSEILLEFDTDPASELGRERIRTLGPYFGLLGGANPGGETAATSLEAHARCAWQALLERTLRLEPLPDPLELLPALDRRWIGSAVHESLHRLFAAAEENPPTFEETLASDGVPLLWPSSERVREVARAAAEGELRRAGRPGGGLVRLLTEQILTRLEVVRRLDESAAGPRLLGSEIPGRVELEAFPGRRERVTFRVDRMSREAATAILADFKIGAPESRLAAVSETKRREKLLAAVRSGSRLQGALYLAAVPDGPAEARYLFLDPELSDDERTLALAGDAETTAALAGAARILLGARRRGLYPPRLADARLDSEYEGCARCAVAEACVRGDSSFRLRLERWHELQLRREATRGEHDEALWELWRLPADDREAGS